MMYPRKSVIAFLVIGCTFIMWAHNEARAQTPVQPHVIDGTVTATKDVPAYANALGVGLFSGIAGNIRCLAHNDMVTIKQSTIFRVETDSYYYDLSKVCGMRGDFRWPRDATNFSAVQLDTWDRWEQLKIGEHVGLLREMNRVQLSAPRCKKLGYLSRSFDVLGMEMSQRETRIYNSHCVYKVPIMHVMVRYSTTAAATGGNAPGTIGQTWDFRIVGSGSIPAAKTTPIGGKYSASLRPAW